MRSPAANGATASRTWPLSRGMPGTLLNGCLPELNVQSCRRPRGTRDHAALRDVALSMIGTGVCRSSRNSVTLG